MQPVTSQATSDGGKRDRSELDPDWLKTERDDLERGPRLLVAYNAALDDEKIEADLKAENAEERTRIESRIEKGLSDAGENTKLVWLCLSPDLMAGDFETRFPAPVDSDPDVALLVQKGVPMNLAKIVIDELWPKWKDVNDETKLKQRIPLERAVRLQRFCADIPPKWKLCLRALPPDFGSNLLIQVSEQEIEIEQLVERLNDETLAQLRSPSLADELRKLFVPEPRPPGVISGQQHEAVCVANGHPTSEAAGRGADKPTSRSDTEKISQKNPNPRMLDAHCKECIKEFKEYRKLGEPRSMQDIVRDYAANHDGVSAKGLYRRLNDNNVHWKPKAG